MRVLVVINPRSGGGKGRTVGMNVRNHLSESQHDMSYVEGSSLKESLDLVEEQCTSHNFDVLICVGGDGFIHDLLPILIRYRLPLLVIPAGTGNDFARTLGIYGTNYKKLLDSLGVSATSSIDIAMISHGGLQTPFVQILSTGFDSVVNERANNFKRVKGSIKYVIAVLLEVWKFNSVEFDIQIDDDHISGKAMLVCVANGTSYGAGMKIVPSAKNNDGVLDILVVDHVNPLRLLMVFPRVFIGTHINHPKVHLYSGKKISIAGDTLAFADGEKITDLPIEVFIADSRLQVYRG